MRCVNISQWNQGISYSQLVFFVGLNSCCGNHSKKEKSIADRFGGVCCWAKLESSVRWGTRHCDVLAGTKTIRNSKYKLCNTPSGV